MALPETAAAVNVVEFTSAPETVTVSLSPGGAVTLTHPSRFVTPVRLTAESVWASHPSTTTVADVSGTVEPEASNLPTIQPSWKRVVETKEGVPKPGTTAGWTC